MTVDQIYCYLAQNIAHPEWGFAGRKHRYPDCFHFRASKCRPVRGQATVLAQKEPCYDCMTRFEREVAA